MSLTRLFDRTLWWSLDPEELLIVCALARLIRARFVLEIGTFDGNTALNLGLNVVRDGEVVTVDLPLEAERQTLNVPTEYRNVSQPATRGRQLVFTPANVHVRQVLRDSTSFDWRELRDPFDLILIDGCHFETYVQQDTANAFRSVRTGGIVIWHDYGQIGDVSRVVDEVAEVTWTQAIRGTRLAVAVKGKPADPLEVFRRTLEEVWKRTLDLREAWADRGFRDLGGDQHMATTLAQGFAEEYSVPPKTIPLIIGAAAANSTLEELERLVIGHLYR